MKYVYSRIRTFYAIRRNVLHMGKVHFIFSIFFRKGQSERKSLLSFVKHSWGKFSLLNSYMYCFSPHRHKSFLYADLSTSYFYFLHGDVEPSKPHTGLIQLIKNIKTARKRIIVDVELKT